MHAHQENGRRGRCQRAAFKSNVPAPHGPHLGHLFGPDASKPQLHALQRPAPCAGLPLPLQQQLLSADAQPPLGWPHLAQPSRAYDVIRALLWVKTAMAAVMFWTGPDSVLLLCIFIASNRIFTEGTCKLLGLVISDLVDEDYILRRRAHPLSALIFGAAALFAKPGQTIAPLLGTTALDRIGAAGIQQGVFYLLVLVPLCCGAVQLLCWAAFSLRGDALHAVQHKVLSRSRPKSMDM
eukprot:m.160403 g.160403  ORF g.160403 m.160403 type:complete len:238 (+) comp9849_c1_seq7:895-1608(+)